MKFEERESSKPAHVRAFEPGARLIRYAVSLLHLQVAVVELENPTKMIQKLDHLFTVDFPVVPMKT